MVSEGGSKGSMVVEHLKIGLVNVKTMSGRSVEIDEMLSMRQFDFVVCRRLDGGEAALGASESLKFLWIGSEKRVEGVGDLVANMRID